MLKKKSSDAVGLGGRIHPSDLLGRVLRCPSCSRVIQYVVTASSWVLVDRQAGVGSVRDLSGSSIHVVSI